MARARRRRYKVDRANKSIESGVGCRIVVFKRRKKGGRVLAPSQWVRTERCEGKRLRAHNRRQCRGKKKQFVRCR